MFAAVPDSQTPMRLEVRWRDGSQSTVAGVLVNHIYEINQPASTGRVDVTPVRRPEPMFEDVSSLISHAHTEEFFDDWARQPMLPRRLSRLGPGVSWYDFDGDGWEDLIVSSGRGGRLAAYHNDQGRGFQKLDGAPIAQGDQGAALGWPDGQGHRRLLVATSNYEMTPETESEIDVYSSTNPAASQRLPAGLASLGPVATADIAGDGDLGERAGQARRQQFTERAIQIYWLGERSDFRRFGWRWRTRSCAGDGMGSRARVSQSARTL